MYSVVSLIERGRSIRNVFAKTGYCHPLTIWGVVDFNTTSRLYRTGSSAVFRYNRYLVTASLPNPLHVFHANFDKQQERAVIIRVRKNSDIRQNIPPLSLTAPQVAPAECIPFGTDRNKRHIENHA
jgi:hypothetical protein